jgi:PAS domain S-box-containing protein
MNPREDSPNETEDENELLRSVAMGNANSILVARQRAEQELVQAKEALELRTEELARSLAMMRATLESTSDGILVTSQVGEVTGFNENFVDMWRAPRAILESNDLARLLEETSRQFDDPRRFLARIEEIHKSSAPESYDLLELGDGRVFERFSRVQVLDQREMGRVWSFRDITERRRAEEGLATQSEWLRITLSSIGDAVISTNAQGRVTFLNGVAEALTGWSATEGVGRPLDQIFRIVNERTREPVENPALRALREGRVVGLANHTALIARDGTERPIDDSAAPMLDATGTPVGAVMVFRDVSARKMTEEAQALLAAIVESSEDAIVSKTLDGIILSWNSGAKRLFGYEPREAVGQPITLIIPPDRQAEERAMLERLRRGERIEHFETVRVTKDGRSLQISLSISPVRDAQGCIIGASKVARDITGQKEAEEALREAKRAAEEANHAKTQFLAMLSHELRTPINPILLAVTAMLERPEDPEYLRPTLEMIRQNVNLLTRLIDDLLDVMRIVRGKMPMHWQVADAHRLINQAIEVCRSEVVEKGQRLETDLSAVQHYVNADEDRLQQVFWNLIKNAVKFTPVGGAITIRTRNRDDLGGPTRRLVVEVSDTGIGIDSDAVSIIFDPFQQGEATITRSYGGLGLGLSICRGIVEAHGGTLEAVSAGKGKGATFRVALQALETSGSEIQDDPAPNARATQERRSPSLRILVVEDEPATLRLMGRLLRGLGHSVTTASTIKETLDALEMGKFDVIVSDIGLPDGSGLELMRRVVSRHGPVPAIALTGYGMEEDVRRSRDAGFAAHLTKPIDFAKLEAMIRQITR